MPILSKPASTLSSTLTLCFAAVSEATKALVEATLLKENTGASFTQTAVVDGKAAHTQHVFVEETASEEAVRVALGNAIREASKWGETEIDLLFEGASAEKQAFVLPLLGEAFGLTLYKFKGYKTAPAAPEFTISVVSDLSEQEVSTLIEKGANIALGTNIARNTINEPADVIYPLSFAKLAAQYGEEFGFACEIMEKDLLTEKGFNLHLAVGQGGAHPPVLAKLTYTGASEETPFTALVGKGVTLDSGGYCLKEAKNMQLLKMDMGGAAAVLGAMCAIAKNKLNANVIALIPLCENFIGKSAYLPGAVITSLSGKTVEVTNTDAEGRLILADSLYYASTMENVDKVIDIATLTGSAAVTFGTVCAAAFTNNDALLASVQAVGTECGELLWQLPLYDEYRALLMSGIADMQNSASAPMAGAISAGMFLKEFVGEKEWLHIDMAGASMSMAEMGYKPNGINGYGARLLYHYIAK